MWGAAPAPGDVVVARRTIPVTLADHLGGGGIRPGTRGVVLDRTGSRIEVRFDTGWGGTTVRVPTAHCAVRSRGVGVGRFDRRVRTMTTVRVALALFLLWPFLWFGVVYVWSYRTVDGLLPAVAVGTIDGAGSWLATAVAHPVQSLVYAAFLGVVGRIAFRR